MAGAIRYAVHLCPLPINNYAQYTVGVFVSRDTVYTSPPVPRSIAISMSVYDCLSLCLPVCLFACIIKTTGPDLIKFCVRITCGRGSVLL